MTNEVIDSGKVAKVCAVLIVALVILVLVVDLKVAFNV